jgi:hypothetical protein
MSTALPLATTIAGCVACAVLLPAVFGPSSVALAQDAGATTVAAPVDAVVPQPPAVVPAPGGNPWGGDKDKCKKRSHSCECKKRSHSCECKKRSHSRECKKKSYSRECKKKSHSREKDDKCCKPCKPKREKCPCKKHDWDSDDEKDEDPFSFDFDDHDHDSDDDDHSCKKKKAPRWGKKDPKW